MRSSRSIRTILLLVVGLWVQPVIPACAAIIEEVVKLPVTVTTSSGQSVTRDVVVTVLRDESRAKSPYLILNHGRAGKDSERRGIGRMVYRKQSEWFVAQGLRCLCRRGSAMAQQVARMPNTLAVAPQKTIPPASVWLSSKSKPWPAMPRRPPISFPIAG